MMPHFREAVFFCEGKLGLVVLTGFLALASSTWAATTDITFSGFSPANNVRQTSPVYFSGTVASGNTIQSVSLWGDWSGTWQVEDTRSYAAATNMLSNSDFEVFTGNTATTWNCSYDISAHFNLSADTGHAGTAQKITITQAGGWGMFYFQNPAFVQGRRYTWTFWYRTDGSNTLDADVCNPEHAQVVLSETLPGTSGAWQQASYTFVWSNAFASGLRISLSQVGSYWLDDFSLLEVGTQVNVLFNQTIPAGHYTWALQASDGAGTQSSETRNLEVANPSPQTGNPYSQWSNSLPSDVSFFPLAVWLQSPGNALKYQNIGINTYVGLWEGPNESQLTELKARGMYVVAAQNSVGLSSANKDIIRAWAHQDEPDNAQSNGSGGYGPCIAPSVLVDFYNTWKANDPTRPVFLNFGQGVSFIGWYGRWYLTNIGGKDYSVAGGHYSDYYTEAAAGADIIAYDIYPVVTTDTEVAGKLECVAQGVKNLLQWTSGSKLVWNCIETTHISNPSIRPSPSQVRSEVWSSIIAGSRGIIYFCHEWEPSFREDGFFRYPEIVDAITGINAQITSLAPVLNSSTIQNAVLLAASDTNVPMDCMVKQYGGDTYLFASALRNISVTGTFTLNSSANNTVEVLGESRQVNMSNGVFQDSFAGYAVHLYRISSLLVATATPAASGIASGWQNQLRVYPNPHIAGKGNGVIFNGLPAKANIRIFSLAGESIFEFKKDNAQSQYVWLAQNQAGKPVASGVYLYLINNQENHESKKGKIVIVK